MLNLISHKYIILVVFAELLISMMNFIFDSLPPQKVASTSGLMTARSPANTGKPLKQAAFVINKGQNR